MSTKIQIKPTANGKVTVHYIDKDGKPQTVLTANSREARKLAEKLLK